MFQTKVVEDTKTHILCSITFFEKRVFYEKMLENILQRGKPYKKMWRMSVACWIPKATNTHTRVVCNTHSFSSATSVAEEK